MNAVLDKPTTPGSLQNPAGPDFNVEQVNPLSVPAWDGLVRSHPGGQFFHSQAWLQVLHETYGFEPLAFWVRSDSQIRALVVLMEARAGLWGRRGVSLPFSDECPPLETPEAPLGPLVECVLREARRRGWASVEYRGGGTALDDAPPSLSFLTHELDLRPGVEGLWSGLDDSVRRAIRKAERAGLALERHHDESGFREYYALHCETRQRHGLPPQPWVFFRAIHRHILAQDKGDLFLARAGGRAVAGAVFFRFGGRVFYKFGASAAAFQDLRPNNAVMWAALKNYAQAGWHSLHWGRTSVGQEGLRRYKLGWGTREEKLNYFKYDVPRHGFVLERDHTEGWHTVLFRKMPISLLQWWGELLYPYLA